MTDFTLFGSPHSLPTYKVALMLSVSRQPFSFRYVSFQKGMHFAPEFLALSRWGQIPVLIADHRTYLQSLAIVEHLAKVLGRFEGQDTDSWQCIREWLYWDADVLFPPIFECYGAELSRKKLLPIAIEPVVAARDRQRAAKALTKLAYQLSGQSYLCGARPTIADICCYADIVFARLCALPETQLTEIARWGAKIDALDGVTGPFNLLPMADAEIGRLPG